MAKKESEKMSVNEAGQRGGKTTLQRYGPDFFSKIGKKGGARVRKLIEAGRALLDEEKKR